MDIQHYDIIYRLVEGLGSTVAKALPPVAKDTIIGAADVLQTFKIGGKSSSFYSVFFEIFENPLKKYKIIITIAMTNRTEIQHRVFCNEAPTTSPRATR